MLKFTKGIARDARPSRRIARDQEEDLAALKADLKELMDDPNSEYGDLAACLASYFPVEAAETHREVAKDQRGIHAWAKDRREKYRTARDIGPESISPPLKGPVEEFRRDHGWEEGVADRRRGSAHDMALDAKARRDPALASFRARYPNASRIEPL